MSQRHQQQAQDMEVKQRAVIELQVKLRASNDKITSLENALSKADDKIQALRHDYQFASQEKANLAGQIKQLQATLSKDKVGAN